MNDPKKKRHPLTQPLFWAMICSITANVLFYAIESHDLAYALHGVAIGLSIGFGLDLLNEP